MIKRIEMQGIKGQNTSQELSGRDIIIGRNGAGKTTRLQAMSLAALGYVPGKGKTAADTFELSSEDTMSVGIVADDFEVERVFKKSGKLASDGTVDFKIAQDITISPSAGERTIKEKEQRIREEIGDLPAMLDFGAFTELTDIKQRDFIYNLSGRFSWDREKVETHLAGEVLKSDLRDNNPEMFEVMKKNFDDTMKQYGSRADVQSGLLAMTEHAKDQLSYWKKEKSKADAAAQKLTEIKNRAGDTDRQLNENIAILTELEKERESSVKEAAVMAAKNVHIRSERKKLDDITEEIERLSEAGEGNIEDLQRELNELESKAAELKDQQQTKQKTIREKDNEIQVLIARIDAAKNRYYKLEEEIISCKGYIKLQSSLIEQIHENAGRCALSHDIPCPHEFTPFINETQKEIDEKYELLDGLMEQQREADSTIKTLQLNMQELRNEKKELQDDLSGIAEILDMNDSYINETRKKLSEIENAAPTIAAKQEMKAKIEAWLEENPEVDLTDHNEKTGALKEEIDALRVTIDEQKKIRNNMVNIQANIIDSKTAAYEKECWQQIVTAIGQKGIQGEMVKEMLDPLREQIDEKLQAMKLPYRFYFRTENDRGKEVFEFGGTIDGNKRPFDALSQGEQLLVLIALMTTIIESSNPPIKILAIDNINHLDAYNLNKVISGLNEAGKGMDNIILAGTPQIAAEDAPGWTVWNLN